LRTGTGAGAAPSSFDVIAAAYDSFGRALKQSNPYAGDSQGQGSPSYWTSNTYDLLWRVTAVTLPDDTPQQPSRIAVAFNGRQTTVTDQVGRKRRTVVDGFGRIESVVEQNPVTGQLDAANWKTTYEYDALDNLTKVLQGARERRYKYDGLSRMTYERTPEQEATIDDGTGTMWSASSSYTDFDAVDLRRDARGVATNFDYDSLNRLSTATYTLPAGSTTIDPTPQVRVSYVASGPAKGKVSEIKDIVDNNGVAKGEKFIYGGATAAPDPARDAPAGERGADEPDSERERHLQFRAR
jgi:YD repeat-containing protein